MEAKALYSFVPNHSDELGFDKDDILLVLDGSNEDEWRTAVNCKDSTRKKGMVPMNYLNLVPQDWYKRKISRKKAEDMLLKDDHGYEINFLLRDSESTPGEFSLSVRFKSGVQHFKILRDGSGKFFLWVVKFSSISQLIEHHKTVSVSRTETILLKGTPKEGGEETQHFHQQKPKSCDNTTFPEQQVKCLYDFDSGAPDELQFKKGDGITVLEKVDDESWWRGRNERTNEVGLFPINYVQK
ncbi:growth factor receptor-bound protein 2-like [Ylistrum balloti]|uniref:growth factor receptor-bound protein 2-like n=1 Tax=Ylistrum balloti TaxID=509963 RepID=UPI002905C84E|nr:growth factor receptor-bound protein 2-like [Ylistrum balloti]